MFLIRNWANPRHQDRSPQIRFDTTFLIQTTLKSSQKRIQRIPKIILLALRCRGSQSNASFWIMDRSFVKLRLHSELKLVDFTTIQRLRQFPVTPFVGLNAFLLILKKHCCFHVKMWFIIFLLPACFTPGDHLHQSGSVGFIFMFAPLFF